MSKRTQASSSTRIRESRRAQRQRRRTVTGILIGAGVIVIVGVTAAVVVASTRPPAGEVVPIMADASAHVDIGQTVTYSTNPPTSGPHYGESAEPGFYEVPVDDGYLVHSLEHGYVILWYDCDGLDAEACASIKDDIREVVNGGVKLIGMPRSGMETPIALTSWGRILRLDYFDDAQVRAFIRTNLGNAPEPQGH